jgi:molybdenum cofactor cytidylyltransferase
MLQVTREAALASGLPCRVCARADDVAVAALLRALEVEMIPCASAGRGMGSTLAEGIAACDDWDGLLVALADMPWVQSETYATLASALRPDSMVQAVYRRRAGNPCGFARGFYAQLQALEGDRGGRQLLLDYPGQVIRVELEDAGIHRDLDTRPA